MTAGTDVAILDAVLRILEDRTLAELDLDLVAAEAGVTRRDVIERFHDRDYLLVAVNQHLAHRFELSLFRAAGGEPDTVTLVDRISAYVTAATHKTSKAPLRLLLDPDATAEHREPWIELYQRWSLRGPEIDAGDSVIPLMARLVVDGLWQYEVLNGEISDELRGQIRVELLRMLDGVRDPAASRGTAPST